MDFQPVSIQDNLFCRPKDFQVDGDNPLVREIALEVNIEQGYLIMNGFDTGSVQHGCAILALELLLVWENVSVRFRHLFKAFDFTGSGWY